MNGTTQTLQTRAAWITLGLVCGLTVALTPQVDAKPQDKKSPAGGLIVNGVPVSSETQRSLEQRYQVKIPAGKYWYDSRSGAWGMEGGATMGFTHAGLTLGGPLKSNASHGNTGVFFNGRELPVQDVAALQQLGPVYRGRWWLDAQGNVGAEGGPAFANIVALAQAAGSRGGAWSRSSRFGDSHVGGDGNGFAYYIDRNSSASVGP